MDVNSRYVVAAEVSYRQRRVRDAWKATRRRRWTRVQQTPPVRRPLAEDEVA